MILISKRMLIKPLIMDFRSVSTLFHNPANNVITFRGTVDEVIEALLASADRKRRGKREVGVDNNT